LFENNFRPPSAGSTDHEVIKRPETGSAGPGEVGWRNILYESQDWPMQSQFQRQIRLDADIGLVMFDNVRLDSAGGRATMIRSAFLEGFVTSAEVTLASPGAREALRVRNKYVVTINTNDGAMSPDCMNRSLSIHLAPVGDVQGSDAFHRWVPWVGVRGRRPPFSPDRQPVGKGWPPRTGLPTMYFRQ
jgi:hypothetical protein